MNGWVLFAVFACLVMGGVCADIAASGFDRRPRRKSDEELRIERNERVARQVGLLPPSPGAFPLPARFIDTTNRQGGLVPPGKRYWIGENGPEVVA